MHLDEFLSFLRGLHRTYDQARRKIQGGSDGYLVNQPRWSELMGYQEFLPSLTPGNTTRENKRRYACFKRMGIYLMLTLDEGKGGFQSIKRKH